MPQLLAILCIFHRLPVLFPHFFQELFDKVRNCFTSRNKIVHAIAASMHEIPSFLSISAMLLNEKFVVPDKMRLTY